MRLVVCSSNYPNPVEPNKGIFMHRTFRAMAGMSDLVVVAPVPYFPRGIPSARYARYGNVPPQATLDGVSVLYPRVFVTPKIGRSLYGLFYAMGLLGPMARLVREHRPEALLAFWAYPDGVASVILARHFRLPVFVGALGCDVNDLDAHFGKRQQVRWAFRRSTGAMAVSRALGERIVRLGVPPDRVAVVPNGLDDDYLAMSESGHAEDLRPGTTVLYCGRLSPEKDPLYLMEAAKILLGKRPDVRITFVGDGALRPQVERLAADWAIAGRVTLVGEVPHDRVPEYMTRADVLCLPSAREGHPNVVLEALACGLPVVATDVGGVPEILKDDSLGTLVPLGRPDMLAEALDAALRKNWDRQRLRQAVGGRSWHAVAREMLTFVEQILA